MSDKQLTGTRCTFIKAWIGLCGAETGEAKFCDEHDGLKCVSCGEEAVRQCEHTGGLVCGYPLCATCQHGIPPMNNPGFLGLGGGHVTKEVYEQQWKEFMENV